VIAKTDRGDFANRPSRARARVHFAQQQIIEQRGITDGGKKNPQAEKFSAAIRSAVLSLATHRVASRCLGRYDKKIPAKIVFSVAGLFAVSSTGKLMLLS
jgi:hypothetical protein